MIDGLIWDSYVLYTALLTFFIILIKRGVFEEVRESQYGNISSPPAFVVASGRRERKEDGGHYDML